MSSVKVLNDGELEVLEVFGDDLMIDRAARVSFTGGKAEDRQSDDVARLIDYLMRHNHATPFEMPSVMFRIKAPLSVVQQLLRHRTFSFNQISARYKQLPDTWHEPREWRGKPDNAKQGSDGVVEYAKLGYTRWPAGDTAEVLTAEQVAYEEYEHRIESGVCKEQARDVLPHGMYTELIVKADLRNLLHFLQLRMDSHAQQEIREYANVLADAVRRAFPLTWAAFEEHRLGSVTLSKSEAASLGAALLGGCKKEGLVQYFEANLPEHWSKSRKQEALDKLRDIMG